MDPDKDKCSADICLPEKITCSFLGNPLFWIGTILTALVVALAIVNTDIFINSPRIQKAPWIENINQTALKWMWGILLIGFFLIPTFYLISDFRKIRYSQGEHSDTTYSRCVAIGYGLVLLLILLQSYCYRYILIVFALVLSAVISIVLMWMIWLAFKMNRGKILITTCYTVMILWFILIAISSGVYISEDQS